jgi:hypothetical protein
MNIEEQYLETARAGFRATKDQADRAIAQVSDADLDRRIDAESNSIAVLIRHVAGNLRSRWTDFLTTDGEKPDRDRDGEFEDRALSRADLLADWEAGWARALESLDALGAGDLQRTVIVRGETLSVIAAIDRQTRHHAGHAAQIALLAKHFAGDGWQTLTMPRRRR